MSGDKRDVSFTNGKAIELAVAKYYVIDATPRCSGPANHFTFWPPYAVRWRFDVLNDCVMLSFTSFPEPNLPAVGRIGDSRRHYAVAVHFKHASASVYGDDGGKQM